MRIDYLKILRKLFRDWYGNLSIEELTTNQELVTLISKIEMQINKDILGGAI